MCTDLKASVLLHDFLVEVRGEEFFGKDVIMELVGVVWGEFFYSGEDAGRNVGLVLLLFFVRGEAS